MKRGRGEPAVAQSIPEFLSIFHLQSSILAFAFCGSGKLTLFRFICYDAIMIDLSVMSNRQANGLDHHSRGQRPRKNTLKGSRPVRAIQNFTPACHQGESNHCDLIQPLLLGLGLIETTVQDSSRSGRTYSSVLGLIATFSKATPTYASLRQHPPPGGVYIYPPSSLQRVPFAHHCALLRTIANLFPTQKIITEMHSSPYDIPRIYWEIRVYRCPSIVKNHVKNACFMSGNRSFAPFPFMRYF
jgi:hypothetical protein